MDGLAPLKRIGTIGFNAHRGALHADGVDIRQGNNKNMDKDEKQKSRAEEEKKVPRPMRVGRKIAEPPGNLRKREQWFRKRSGE